MLPTTSYRYNLKKMKQALIKLLGGYTEEEMRDALSETPLQKMYRYMHNHSYILFDSQLAGLRELDRMFPRRVMPPMSKEELQRHLHVDL